MLAGQGGATASLTTEVRKEIEVRKAEVAKRKKITLNPKP